ncbi:hypothetical protein Tco_0544033 [Tanacetum coccineum]
MATTPPPTLPPFVSSFDPHPYTATQDTKEVLRVLAAVVVRWLCRGCGKVNNSMYKKDVSLKTLEKNQGKVDDIDKLLDQEILLALRRFCISYEYVEAEEVQDNAVHGVDEIKAKITEINNDTETMQTEIQNSEDPVRHNVFYLINITQYGPYLRLEVSLDMGLRCQADQHDQTAQTDEILNDDMSEHSNHTNEQISEPGCSEIVG